MHTRLLKLHSITLPRQLIAFKALYVVMQAYSDLIKSQNRKKTRRDHRSGRYKKQLPQRIMPSPCRPIPVYTLQCAVLDTSPCRPIPVYTLQCAVLDRISPPMHVHYNSPNLQQPYITDNRVKQASRKNQSSILRMAIVHRYTIESSPPPLTSCLR